MLHDMFLREYHFDVLEYMFIKSHAIFIKHDELEMLIASNSDFFIYSLAEGNQT